MHRRALCKDSNCKFCAFKNQYPQKIGIQRCPLCGLDQCENHIMLDYCVHNHERDNEYTPVSSMTVTVDLLGNKKYELTDKKDHTLLLNKEGLPAVYVFYDNEDVCWYVGQTTDVYDRIRRHLKGSEPTTADRGINMLFYKIEIFDVYHKDASHLALLEQMVIVLRKPKYNITANGIDLQSKDWLDKEIAKNNHKIRDRWPKQEQDNLKKFYFDRKEGGYRKKLPILKREGDC